jgi:hypothetical protein
MKIIINQNERGFLFRNGTYRRMLQPGKNQIYTFLGETYARIALDKPIKVPGTEMEILMADKEFAQNVIKIDVPDGYVAVRFEDGRVVSAHEAGKYFYFNYYQNVSSMLFDISKVDIEGLTPEQINRLPRELYLKVVVAEGETGLLFWDGKFNRALCAGAYYFWNTKTSVTCERSI